MDTNLATSIISASSAVVVAVVALIVNVVWIGRAFSQLDSKLSGQISKLDANLSARMDRIERRLDVIEADCKEFYRIFARHDKEIALLQQKSDGS